MFAQNALWVLLGIEYRVYLVKLHYSSPNLNVLTGLIHPPLKNGTENNYISQTTATAQPTDANRCQSPWGLRGSDKTSFLCSRAQRQKRSDYRYGGSLCYNRAFKLRWNILASFLKGPSWCLFLFSDFLVINQILILLDFRQKVEKVIQLTNTWHQVEHGALIQNNAY